ncbi:MAG: EAL domain-containing protein, partial [Candidatus Eremiobacteraeota bacterium]|nr:EAL domain-containing protein [Candidatus Eremiobacteraeota bacterium]
DELIKRLATALQRAARENIVYRTSPESFTVLCPEIAEDLSVDELGASLAAAADDALVEFGARNANIAAAAYARDGHNVGELERALRDALDEARTDDTPDLIFRSLASDSEVRHRRAIRRELHDALRNGELSLLFQPYTDLRTNAFIGAEALLRWNSPARGLVLPGEFIPIAEQTDLICEIGTWVMREALRTAAPWQRFREFEIAINVSAKQVGPALVDTLDDVLKDTGFDPTCLVIEITESTAMDVNRDVLNVLNRCHALGVRIAIDDFGTGYSSLAYLKKLPVDIVKLDRAFVEGLPQDPFDAAIASAVIAMGTRFGSLILAEGVETDEQLQWLRMSGCSLAQGFRLAPPMPPDELAGLLAVAVA